MQKQRTLENTICATGMGLHSGQKVNLSLRPASPNTGIVFRRVDLDVPVEILATVDNVVDLNMATTLGKSNATVSNVEVLLAAFTGMGIDNAFVDINAEEVPAMDGSAGTFVFLIQSAGIREQDEAKKFIRIKKPISVSLGDQKVQLSPCDQFKLTCFNTYQHPSHGSLSKKVQITLSPSVFQREISRARSFSFARDEEILHNSEQSLDGIMENTVIIDNYRIKNMEALRYENEFLRHQLLDTIGDLSLLGCGLMAEYVGCQSNHKVNNRLLNALLKDRSAWEFVSASGLPEEHLDTISAAVAAV